MRKIIAFIAVVVLLGNLAWAATHTVTLSVPDMTCAACPVTVRKALQKVDGVKVTWEPKEAVVTFDDARTDAKALAEATRKAGYPSTVKPQP